jgi:hypothetical protein
MSYLQAHDYKHLGDMQQLHHSLGTRKLSTRRSGLHGFNVIANLDKPVLLPIHIGM